jgi:hypothetical protein
MTCDAVSKLIPLYYYGELTPDEEDALDSHLPECVSCAAEVERHRAMAGALDRRHLVVPPILLEDCRSDLMMALTGAGSLARQPAPRSDKPPKSAWTLFLEALNISMAGFGRMRQPVAAAGLVALGFLAARFITSIPAPAGNLASADIFNTVRAVKPDNSGRVQITYDETRRRQIVGRPDDPDIQKFLVAGARDENAAVRVESVGLLSHRSDSPQVVDSLLNVLMNDQVDGVRLKALDALRPVAGDPRVIKALSQVLLTDANPTVKMKVIDLMMAQRDDSMVGVLQNLVQREDDTNVRSKAFKVLKDLNASQGTF